MNLICAAEFIAKTDFAGVAICMHDSSADDCCAILPATKTRKMHTSRRDAFRAINDTAIARINYKTKEIKPLTEFINTQSRFSHLKKEENKHIVEELQADVKKEWEDLLKKEELTKQ